MTIFVAVDGEAVGPRDDARYALLCSSTERPLWSADGLRTKRILDYLMALQNPREEVICYGLNYDANQWLVDLPDPYLRELWTTGRAVWRGYKLEWVPSRWLVISHPKTGGWVKVQEVFGFFQTSFLDALERWGIEVPDALRREKAARGTHTPQDRARLTSYCRDECAKLVTIMERVADAAERAGCTPHTHTWIGAGALAGTLLRTNGVQAHHQHDRALTDDQEAIAAIMTAYHGGRVEVFRQGRQASVATLDIRSAYPSALRTLPSLAGARLVPRRRFRMEALHAIWRASWSVPDHEIMPLPVRSEGAIWWPRNGSGWYHACEIRAALHAGYPITVGGGYELATRSGSVRPFDFVDSLYAARARFARASDPAESILKLGMNSIYGKLAQGYKGNFGKPEDPPRWQSYWWAGELTAQVRARMLTTLLSVRRPLFVATDGVYADNSPVQPSRHLGGWKTGRVDRVFVVQPGVYQAHTGDKVTAKAAGFFHSHISYDELQDLWDSEGVDGVYRYESERFVGLGTALAGENLDAWREWQRFKRNIFLRPRRKDTVYHDGEAVSYPKLHAPGDSEPYTPKIRLLESIDPDKEQGMDQPLRTAV